ncbi:hypothetical protein T05_14091 [Trichinella murrelli]|uniref:Uncharacterized protein n=1 Tax=Trichinella murrelli TaxID=144512 RepID=A0A0V0T7W9_9BILA|nr:hypothetical protein T05_14091 [Trichinella murrelli]
MVAQRNQGARTRCHIQRQLCKFAIDVVLRLCFSANLVVIVTPQEERNLNDNVMQFFTLNNVMSNLDKVQRV